MHFTGLKIVGFKSFADPVDFAIREGLTGIVGPNGCGKSNILEGLRWVMGATSARAMRGGEMDDLIFSGSANRPQRENAEVALILDNSDRRAPAELNDSDELEVKRRLRRGAGSTYKINGRTVRAKDVQLLFADASTGANSPALVRQGQISELIASKPQNRRRILEEAAGIAGLNQRRHEAELKLRGASESLARLDEIIGEVDKQLNSLKRQAGRAKKYRALQEQIEALEAQIAFYKWQAAKEEVASAIASVETFKVNTQSAATTEAQAVKIETELREKTPSLRDAESEASAQLGVLKLEIAKLDGERKAASDAIIRLEKDLQRIIEDQSREHALREEAIAASENAQNSLDNLPEDNSAEYEEKHQRLEAQLFNAQRELAEHEKNADALSQQLATAQAKAENAQSNLTKAQANKERLEREKLLALDQLSEIGSSKALDTENSTLKQNLETAEKRLSQAQIESVEAETKLQNAVQNEKAATAPLNDIEKAIRILEAEISGLKRLCDTPTQNQSRPILDETHPEAGLEKALAAALGDDLNASTNKSDTQYWSDTHGQHLSSLPSNTIPLTKLVNAPKALEARLSQCGLVEVEHAKKLQKELHQGQCLVSKAGDLWRWDGFVKTAKAASSASEKLEQRAKIKLLEKDLSKALKQEEQLKLAKENAESTLLDAQNIYKTLQKTLPNLALDVARAKESVMQNEQAKERLVLRASNIEEKLAHIESSLVLAITELDTAQSALENAPSQHEHDVLDNTRTQIRELRQQEREYHNLLKEHENEYSRARGRRTALQREQRDWLTRSERADKRLDELHTQRSGVRHQLETTKAQPDALSDRLMNLNTRLEEAQSHRNQASDTLSVHETELKEAESEARSSRDTCAKLRESLIREETRLEAAQRREEDIGANIEARYDVNYEQLSAIVVQFRSTEEDEEFSFDLSTAETQLAVLTRDREALGGVNMEADLQVEETAERLETQLRERDDLDQAIAKLQEGVHALNAQGRELLLEAFEKVAEHFRVLFEALFEGGEAQLKLTESDDPLQAGLEIYASPPGKRLSALSLMSGGEQALTAAALIFAVFLSQPSPLCVLDEVDAPLDDANVDRFCRMLDTMRSKTDTRFVVITHNPVTMSRMDRLYGVTMQERGVSRLVSVDLQSAEQLVAAQ